MNAGNPDLRPFRERVLEAIDLKQPGSGLLSGHDVLCFLRGRIGSWVDERLRLYERTSAEAEELRADRVKLQGEIERLTHELTEARGSAERPFDPYGETADIEALAQRLAKVEDRLSGIDGLRKQLAALASRLDGAATDARLDQVCDIIGTRIGGLEERLNANVENVTYDRKRVDTIIADDLPAIAEALGEIRRLTLTPSVPFPTGAGTTVEDAFAQAVYTEEAALAIDLSHTSPPRRGDRVRLEGAHSIAGVLLGSGWYDVYGYDAPHFQVGSASSDLRWVRHDDPGLKEVRRGDAAATQSP